MKLALHVIAKNEKEQIDRIIKDYGEYFDEIAIAVDDNSVFSKLQTSYINLSKLKLHLYEWIDDFADKRNFLADKTESEYYLRLDTDDVIHNPQNIRSLFSDMIKNGMDVVYVPYLYAKDEDGNCIAKHWRETIIKKDSNFKWVGAVHESIVVDDLSKYKGIKDDRVMILHETDAGHHKRSAKRNFDILMKEFKRDKEETDPRTLAYIGRALLGAEHYKKAKSFLELLVLRSGWDEDKYFALCEIGMCWSQMGDYDRAVTSCNDALAINVEYPDAYLELCEIYNKKKDYNKAIHWGEIGISKSEPQTLYILDPTKYTYRAYVNLAIAYFHIGHYKKAKSLYDKAAQIAPNVEFIKSNKSLFDEAFENSKFVEEFVNCIKYARKHDPAKCQGLVENIPKNMLQDERMHYLRNEFIPGHTWVDKSVVIYCGRSWEDWAAPSVIKGIGGSEEAVIYLSKELTKLGWSVTVYNNCGELAGEYEGVKYKNYYEFSPKDEFNVFISWRANMFAGQIKAKRKLVWLHDVPINQLGKGEEEHFDKVIVLSEFHKSLLPENIPEDKIFVSKNGINNTDFRNNGITRNPKRMIYTSSYDRGIQHLLKNWDKVIEAVPDAELHLFYGWNTYDRMLDEGIRDSKFKQEMVRAMEQKGIFEHGRVGHKKLVKEFQKSGLYVYPSHFEEISCISAMKAQECGCVPVTTDYAALSETVKDGLKVPGRCGTQDVDMAYINELIAILKDEVRQEELRVKVLKHKGSFGWERVAKQWSEELFEA